MNGFSALICFVLSIFSGLFLIVYWVFLPYSNPEMSLNMAPFITIFYGNFVPVSGVMPESGVKILLLLSRLSLGVLVTLSFFLMSFSYLVEFDYKTMIKKLTVYLSLLSIFLFFSSLIYLQFFHM